MRFFSFRVAAAALLLGASKPVPAAPTAEAEAYLDQAITLLETRHINSAEADWERLRAEAETAIEEARTPADTYPAIHRLLAELGERHSFLIEPQPTPAQPNGSTSPRSAPSGGVAMLLHCAGTRKQAGHPLARGQCSRARAGPIRPGGA